MTLRSIATLALLCVSCATPDASQSANPQTSSTVAHDPPSAARSTRAYLEPEDGRVLHLTGGTVGQYDMVYGYARMTGPELAPIGDSIWISIPGTRPWPGLRAGIERRLRKNADQGNILNLSVGFDHGHVSGPATAGDRDVADGAHDDQIDDLARMLRDSGVPTLLRIGNELNGPWEGLHPYDFPRAYRRIVERFRALGVSNVAFVWCVVPGGDAAIFETDARGAGRWYPGDDVVDWLSLDVFGATQFDSQSTRGSSVVADVLAAARRKGKPVLIGETTPCQTNIRPLSGPDAGYEAERVWDQWFDPFVRWLDDHPEIKAVTMISVDWTRTKQWRGWGDARIQNNPFLAEMWREELRRPRWVNWPEFVRQTGASGPGLTAGTPSRG